MKENKRRIRPFKRTIKVLALLFASDKEFVFYADDACDTYDKLRQKICCDNELWETEGEGQQGEMLIEFEVEIAATKIPKCRVRPKIIAPTER